MSALSGCVSVTSGDLVRQFGRWQDQATSRPVLVTHHGRERVVLLSTAHYHELIAPAARADAAARPGDDVALLEQVMEYVAQGFIAFAADMTITAINRAACCFLKTVRGAVVGFRLDERLPGIEETLGYASLSRAALSGSILTFEMPSFAFPGRWLLVQTFPFGDGVACLFRDITDEVDTRHHFDLEKAGSAALAIHRGIGRARLSPAGTFVDVDEAIIGFTGFSADELRSLRLIDLLCGNGGAQTAQAIEAVLKGGASWAADIQLLDKAGRGRGVHIGLAPLWSRGRAEGALLAATLIA